MEARERIPEALLDLAAEPQRRREIGAGAQRAWAAGRGAIVRAVSALRGRFARGS